MKRLLFVLLSAPIFLYAQDEKGIKWTTGLTLDQVKQKAAAENKYIFFDCYATWCGPCREMDKRIFTNDSVGDYFNQHFISIRVQLDQPKQDEEQIRNWHNDATEIAKQYDIKGFPSFLFLNPQGVITDLQTGYKNVSELIAIAQIARQPGKTYNTTLSNYNNLVLEYQKGNMTYSKLPMMIEFAARLDTALRAELMNTYKKYLIALSAKDRCTEENIRFWSSLNFKFSKPFVEFFLKEGDYINQVMDYKEYSSDIIDKTIQAEIVIPFFQEQNTRKNIPITGEAEAAATKARGDAAASAIKAKALAEADGIKARAEALGTNQDAVISQQLAENMPAIIAAAAEPFAHVGQLTVLNGGEGVNRMIGGILAQVGDYLPALGPRFRNGTGRRPGRSQAAAESP